MPGEVAFIDTNVLVYHLVQSNHELGPESSALLSRLRVGTENGYVSSTVIFECIYTLKRNYGASNLEIADSLLEILGFAGLHTDHPEALVEALSFWRMQGPLSFADCFHLALAKQLGMTRMYSFDRRMDRYPGVTRVEPT